jgi:hypothetical protein
MRLCRNSKKWVLEVNFRRGLSLKLKNNTLQTNLRGAVFAENNYDTASAGGVFVDTKINVY